MDTLTQNSTDSKITHVSDTALWVAVYRAAESRRSDALFKDQLADRLVGSKGREIEQQMSSRSSVVAKYLSWSVVIRTCMIDQLIEEQIKNGIDTVINLGAGLDTRPYRMKLPPNLQWIEIDFPHMIQYKEEQLKNEKPNCKLERVALDLSNSEAKKLAFEQIAAKTSKAIVITEGVVPYLDEAQVQDLIEDLNRHKQFKYWIVEYSSPTLMRIMKKRGTLTDLMKNSPLKFFPKNLFDFFGKRGWKVSDIRYFAKESKKLGREVAMPWWATIISFILTPLPTLKEKFLNISGFMLLERV